MCNPCFIRGSISSIFDLRDLMRSQNVLTKPGGIRYFRGALDGVVAQLVEHHNGIVGVRGSSPLGSTILFGFSRHAEIARPALALASKGSSLRLSSSTTSLWRLVGFVFITVPRFIPTRYPP